MESLEEIAHRLGFDRLLYQLEDLMTAVPNQGADLDFALVGLGSAFGRAGWECPRTIALLTSAWSAGEPRQLVSDLQNALSRACDLTEAIQRAGVTAMAAVSDAQATASAAVASARTRMPQVMAADISSVVFAEIFGTVVDLSGVVDPAGVQVAIDAQVRTEVFAAQFQVLADLQVVVDAVIQNWDTAMRTAIEALDVSFRFFTETLGGLVQITGGPAGSTPAASPDRTDTNLRLLLDADKLSTDPRIRAFAESTQAALDQAEISAGTSYLLVYDPNSPGAQGALAIGLGELGTAQHVLLMAGGIGTGPDTIPGDITDAVAILTVANAKDPGDRSAAIVYAGYDAPFGGASAAGLDLAGEVAAMTSLVYATAQGQLMNDQLAPILNSLPAGTNVAAFLHSFGTTVGTAALRAGLPVDQVIFTGSPGVGFSSASDLPINPAFQFVMANQNDPVVNQDEILDGALTPLALLWPAAGAFRGGQVLGPSPAQPKYGAQVIDQESGLPVFRAHQTPAYLTAEGIDNVAAILTEQYGDVPIRGEN